MKKLIKYSTFLKLKLLIIMTFFWLTSSFAQQLSLVVVDSTVALKAQKDTLNTLDSTMLKKQFSQLKKQILDSLLLGIKARSVAELGNNYQYSPVPMLHFREENLRGSYRIGVSFFKTTHIIFDSEIKYFDIGSKNVIGEKVEKAENVLKLKASLMENFETNVTVITAGGKYYSFLVNHNENPSKLNIMMNPIIYNGSSLDVDKNGGALGKIIFSESEINEADFKDLANLALKEKNVKHIGSASGKVRFDVLNIRSKGENVFVSLKMKNTSSLNYEVEFLKAFVRDTENGKRDVVQELEVKPTYVYVVNQSKKKEKKIGEAKGVYGVVIMFKKFSIAKNKTFDIDIIEKNGGRNFNLKIDFNTFFYQMTQI